MPKVSIGDAEIYYEESGQGEPLLLVPGLSGQGSFWGPQVARLRARLPGRHPRSPRRRPEHPLAHHVLRRADGRRRHEADGRARDRDRALRRPLDRRRHRAGDRARPSPAPAAAWCCRATWAGPDPYFRRVFESRKEVLQTLGLEAYLRASALFLMPPAWVSANDRVLTEQHRAALAGRGAHRGDDQPHRRHRAPRSARAPGRDPRARRWWSWPQDDMITPRFYSDELASRVPGAKLVVLDGGGHFAPVAAADLQPGGRRLPARPDRPVGRRSTASALLMLSRSGGA